MARQMQYLIKWLYFKYVYPDEVEKVYQLLEAHPIVYLADGPTGMAIIERERIPSERLH